MGAPGKDGADAVANGGTGKGNDQVRFDVGIMALNPSLKVLAPAREWGMSREETIAYGEKFGIESPVKKSSPFTIVRNPVSYHHLTLPTLLPVFV